MLTTIMARYANNNLESKYKRRVGVNGHNNIRVAATASQGPVF